jgi:DNA polymerase-4
VAIKVRLDDWTTVTRARMLDAPTNDAERIAAEAKALLRAYDPPRPVRLLGVRVGAFGDGEERAGPGPPPAWRGDRAGQLDLTVS